MIWKILRVCGCGLFMVFSQNSLRVIKGIQFYPRINSSFGKISTGCLSDTGPLWACWNFHSGTSLLESKYFKWSCFYFCISNQFHGMLCADVYMIIWIGCLLDCGDYVIHRQCCKLSGEPWFILWCRSCRRLGVVGGKCDWTRAFTARISSQEFTSE